MTEKELKIKLYSLYVLLTYEDNTKPSELELKSIMNNSLGTIDNKITTKESLIERLKNIINHKIYLEEYENNRIIEFRLGDIMKTSLSSSRIILKFEFLVDENNKVINVSENNKILISINM